MAAVEAAPAPVSKPKRVRTGCLTCRSRHLKCDEATPDCMNCRKSNRECKRGVRLNFIDITTENPPVLFIAPEYRIEFQDESREIASEYAGGVQKYKPYNLVPTPPSTVRGSPANSQPNNVPASAPPPPAMSTLQLQPLIQPQLPPIQPPTSSSSSDAMLRSHRLSQSATSFTSSSQGVVPSTKSSFSVSKPIYDPPSISSMITPPREARGPKRYLDNAEEALFMQVFVEEVGIWMDSVDAFKHFSRLLPFTALNEPMLLNACLACGARHLSLINPAYSEDKALSYYDTATRLILESLQNAHRDTQCTEMCATTAIVLNVYEIMSEKPLQRMNHIAGARALLKECRWNARTEGVGAACFWLNVTMELLSCLRFKWAVAWHPDEWGVDMDFNRSCESGREELWAHRIIYILAKVACFSESINRKKQQRSNSAMDDFETQKQYEEWCQLRQLCDAWNDHIPTNMHPMAILQPYQTPTKSAFPEVWVIKRCAVIARLFYHTALLVLAQVHPYPSDETERVVFQQAHYICGIAANIKDRGVASVTLRSLALAAEVLVHRHEQEEVVAIFWKIAKETGWRIESMVAGLKRNWGWNMNALDNVSSLPPSAAIVLRNSVQSQEPVYQQEQIQQLAPSGSHDYAPYAGQQSQQHAQRQIVQQQQRQQQSMGQAMNSHEKQQPRPPLVNPLMAATDLNLLMNAHPYHPHYQFPPQNLRSPTLGRHHYN